MKRSLIGLTLAFAVLAGIVAALWVISARNDAFSTLMVSLVAAGAVYSIWHYASTSEASSYDVGAFAVRFAHDEAIQSLRVCARLAAEPHLYVRDLLGGPELIHRTLDPEWNAGRVPDHPAAARARSPRA